MMGHTSLRNNRGAAVITLCLVMSVFLMLIIFFVFDMNRLQMAQRELTAVCDAAALSGSAMLTSKDTAFEDASLATLYTTQMAAIQYAKNMISMGNILGYQCYDPGMGSAIGSSAIKVNFVNSASALSNPSPGVVNVWVQLASPINGYAPVAAGNSGARALLIQANYGYIPYLSILGVQSVSLPATSASSLQKLYVIMVFDCSGSMDDNTNVSFVYRRWTDSTDGASDQANGGKGQYVYTVVGNPGNGELWNYAGLDYSAAPTGTALNVLPPQNLDYLGFAFNYSYYDYANASTYFQNASPPLAFDLAIASYYPWVAYYDSPNSYNYNLLSYPPDGSNNFYGPYYDNYFGTPPGNCRVKYGLCSVSASGSPSYGGQVGAEVSNPAKTLNIWNGSPTMCPGPGYYSGFGGYYNTDPSNNDPSNPPVWDGNTYFYDPNSMPMQDTNTSYAAFTDLVANITTVSPPITQPFYGPASFNGFTESFAGSSSTYAVGVAETASNNLTLTGWYEYDDTLNSIQSYQFENIAWVVEASRGNLDCEWSGGSPVAGTPTNYDNALLAYGSTTCGTIPRTAVQAGYQKAYQRLAMYAMQPYATAVDGAARFFQNMCQTACCNFGFVGFSVAPATTANYNCAYLGSVANGAPSLALGAPTSGTITTRSVSVYSSYVFQPLAGCNPNFWVSDPLTSTDGTGCPAGPAGSPTGEAYHASLNTAGPNRNTWLTTTAGSPPSDTNSLWCYNYPGFQIPRFPLDVSKTQGQAYYGAAGDDWSGFSTNNAGTTNAYGCDGLHHARPLYETAGVEAMQYALYNLTNTGALNGLTGGATAGISLPSEYGAKKVMVVFTDGVPTDDSTPYGLYSSSVVLPAQQSGIPIYAIGLALNSNLQTEQSVFLQTMANHGACGSQDFQVTSPSTLTSTFTGIARQMAQAQR